MTSLELSEKYNKTHKVILGKIRMMVRRGYISEANIIESYRDIHGRNYKVLILDDIATKAFDKYNIVKGKQFIDVVCAHCGKIIHLRKCYARRNRSHYFCNKHCESEYRKLDNTKDNWAGGRINTSTGYKTIRIDGREIDEHRLVMAKHIGRDLRSDEIVHHINGDKLDNRIENLQLLSQSEHMKIHNAKKSAPRQCVRCGKIKEIHGRGLCNACYSYAFVNNTLGEYELQRK